MNIFTCGLWVMMPMVLVSLPSSRRSYLHMIKYYSAVEGYDEDKNVHLWYVTIYTNSCTVLKCRRSRMGKSASSRLLGKVLMSEVLDNWRFEGVESCLLSQSGGLEPWMPDWLELWRSAKLEDLRFRAMRIVGGAKNPELGSSTVKLALPPIWAPGGGIR